MYLTYISENKFWWVFAVETTGTMKISNVFHDAINYFLHAQQSNLLTIATYKELDTIHLTWQ